MPSEPTFHERMLAAIDGAGGSYLDLDTPQVFAVKSKSDPSGFYYLIVYPWDEISCSCKGFRYRDDCSHVRDYRRDNPLDAGASNVVSLTGTREKGGRDAPT